MCARILVTRIECVVEHDAVLGHADRTHGQARLLGGLRRVLRQGDGLRPRGNGRGIAVVGVGGVIACDGELTRRAHRRHAHRRDRAGGRTGMRGVLRGGLPGDLAADRELLQEVPRVPLDPRSLLARARGVGVARGAGPGPALAGLGAGNWPMLLALAGIFAGAYVQGRLMK